MTKSGLMVGLGETHEEMVEAFAALREHGVQVLTVGQYLRPSERHLPVVRYWHPDEFAALERAAYALGFDHVAAGPLVRSSYHADQHVRRGRGSRPLAGVGPPAHGSSLLRSIDPPAHPAGALLFIVGFAFLTVSAISEQGLHASSAISRLHPRAARGWHHRRVAQSSPVMSTLARS